MKVEELSENTGQSRARAFDYDARRRRGRLELPQDFLDLSAGSLLTDLAALMSRVRGLGFERGVRDFFGDDSLAREPLVAVNEIAERIAGELEGTTAAALFRKAFEEVCLDLAGLGYDLERLDIESGLQEFLARRPVSDFIERVIDLYVFYSISLAVQDAGRPQPTNGRSFEDLLDHIHKLSETAVVGVIEQAKASGEFDADGVVGPEAGVRLMLRIRDCVVNPSLAVDLLL